MVYYNGVNFWRINTVNTVANNPTYNQICYETTAKAGIYATSFDKRYIGSYPPFYSYYSGVAWLTDGSAELDYALHKVYCSDGSYHWCGVESSATSQEAETETVDKTIKHMPSSEENNQVIQNSRYVSVGEDSYLDAICPTPKVATGGSCYSVGQQT
jgi:hypothetical protein